MAAKHKTQSAQKHKQSKARVFINCSYTLSPCTCRVSARLSGRKIGEHLAQHIAGLSEFYQKL